MRDPAAVRGAVEATVRRRGRLDVWVNAAGVYPTSPLLELGAEDWELVVDTNLRGTFVGAREAARAMGGTAQVAGGVQPSLRIAAVSSRLARSPSTLPSGIG